MIQVSKIFTISVLALALSLSGCNEEPATEQKETAQVFKAEVQMVQLGTIPLMAVVPGSIVPEQKASIASRLIGYIKGLEVEVGQKVKQGDLLFSIDSADIKSQIAQAEAAYRQAVAALKDARLDYNRFTKLYKDDSVSKQQYDKIRLQYSVAQQNVAAAHSGLKQAKEQLNYANVKAPFDGVVVQKLAVAGGLAAPGKPIVVIENATSLSVKTEVSGDLFAVLHIGDEAQVQVDGQDKAFIGTIYTLVGSANPKTRTHTVKLNLPEGLNINSGTFARVSFKRDVRQTMMISKSAIVVRAGIEGVFVVENGRAFFHMVRTGLEIGSQIEIQAGLALGEQIVIENNESMLNGDIVEVTGVQGDLAMSLSGQSELEA
ncbi:MAG: efflux RND transporter periplasmic adaptor subunit [Gammaproteobacteria bacterium]|nr:efflux RND transporter periplasmic adaptor subunit [Gammaproteobacteria bacterium]